MSEREPGDDSQPMLGSAHKRTDQPASQDSTAELLERRAATQAEAPRGPGWQQPEFAWLLAAPLGFFGPWLAGELGQLQLATSLAPMLAPVLALLAFLPLWIILLRANVPRSAFAALLAWCLGQWIGRLDAGVTGALSGTPLEALGFPVPWLLDAELVNAGAQGVVDGSVWMRIGLTLGCALVAALLAALGLGMLVPLPLALTTAELSAGAAVLARRLVDAGFEDGAAALQSLDPASVLALAGACALSGVAALGSFHAARRLRTRFWLTAGGVALALAAVSAAGPNQLYWNWIKRNL